jgi:hypothetical protein
VGIMFTGATSGGSGVISSEVASGGFFLVRILHLILYAIHLFGKYLVDLVMNVKMATCAMTYMACLFPHF